MTQLDDEAVLGYYEPFYLLASVKHGLEKIRRAPKELEKTLPPESLVAYALARYTYFHEIRHFHDYFGTMAGISLFKAHLQQVRAFASFVEWLRLSGRSLEFPLNFPPQGEGPIKGTIQGLVRNWRIFLDTTAVFTGASFPKTLGECQHPNDQVVLRPRGAHPEGPTFPLSISKLKEGRLIPMTLYYPIGLEVLLEGNTQALQRSIME
jgi:hypothetical protein